MATKKKKSSNGPIVGLLIVGALGLGFLAAYVKYGGAAGAPGTEPKMETHQTPVAAKPETKVDSVTVITPSRVGDELKLDRKQTDVPDGEDPMLFAVNQFLLKSKIVPDDAKAIGVQVKDKVAYLDMTPSFEQSYGSMDEEAILKGVCASLAQFKNVDKVQFIVEGKPVESIGNVDLSDPIPVRTDSPGASDSSTSSP